MESKYLFLDAFLCCKLISTANVTVRFYITVESLLCAKSPIDDHCYIFNLHKSELLMTSMTFAHTQVYCGDQGNTNQWKVLWLL